MNVPFVDLKAQYASLKDEIDEAVLRVMSDAAFIGGRYAEKFEFEFAQYLNAKHCVAVANGTDAIEIALAAVGVRPRDEVLVPANTFIATAEAVSNIGAVPVFVDIDPNHYTLDPTKIEERLTPRSKAIIPVHLYGLPAEMDPIVEIARNRGLKIVEDCAQAHGSTYKGKKVGPFGDAATFSFYPSKNLGAFGDAGAIVTNSAETSAAARLIANHGQLEKNRHTVIGRNSRMDGIQAAVLSIKLKHLDSWLDARRKNAQVYIRLLEGKVPIPTAPAHSNHTYHLFVVRVPERDKVMAKLREAGVESAVHYPIAIPFMEAFSHLGYQPSDVPVAHAQMGELLSLPMYAELTEEMIEYTCDQLLAATSRMAAA